MVSQFMCTICVMLHKPVQIEDDKERNQAVGYYRNFGVGGSSLASIQSLISQSIDDGEIDWNDSTCKEINLESFDKEITAHCDDPTQEKIWYKSGRGFFPEEEKMSS
jgi:hypothetical protein